MQAADSSLVGVEVLARAVLPEGETAKVVKIVVLVKEQAHSNHFVLAVPLAVVEKACSNHSVLVKTAVAAGSTMAAVTIVHKAGSADSIAEVQQTAGSR